MWQSAENVIENPALHNRSPVFADRPDAGAGLALLMGEWVNRDAVICAIPAGGVPVGVPLAAALGLSLDVLVVSKMTLPWNTEAGFVTGRRLHPMKPLERPVPALDIHTVQKKHVKVNIVIQRTPKTLDQHHRTRVGGLSRKARPFNPIMKYYSTTPTMHYAVN